MKKRITLVLIFIVLIAGGVLFLQDSYSVPVLMYHRINEGAESSRLIVSPESFHRQMQFLNDSNYQVLSLDEYVSLLRSGEKPRKKSVVITFDDGYEDNYTNAYPVLKKFQIPATIFVVVGWVGKKDMMNWQQVEELQRSGLIAIESHGMTHCELIQVGKLKAKEEIETSKKILESRLNTEIKYFCYPCGFFTPFIKELTRLSGYRGACATHPGKEIRLNDEFAIRRIRISYSADNMFIFWAQVSGYYTFFKDRRIKSH